MPDLDLYRPRRALTLERLFTDPAYFGVTTASQVQRAVCRVLDGIPLRELATHPDVIEALGGSDAIAALPASRCSELVLLAGIRCGKSQIAAACGIRAARTCDVSRLSDGDIPTVSILSISVNEARKTWNHVVGNIKAKPALSAMLIGEPKANELFLQHPTGRPVRIAIAAGARAAGSLVGDWSAGVIFDEAPRMVGAEDGVVNLDEARQAVILRLLPGAQMLLIGSPWQPFGPVYDLVQDHFGKPSPRMVVVRATGPQMNPVTWTEAACAKAEREDPKSYFVDVLCHFMDPEAGLFTTLDLERCRREWPLEREPEPELYYSAAMDPATRGNAWTLVVLGRERSGKLFVALAKQWIGSALEPLKPSEVLTEIAGILARYRLTSVHSDQWAADAMRDVASGAKLWVASENISSASKLEYFQALRTHVNDGTIELPPDPQFLRDLSAVKKKTTPTGVSIHLPQTSDGRHCDYAPALALALAHPPKGADPVPLPEPGTEARQAIDAAAEKEAARLQVEKRLRTQLRRNGGLTVGALLQRRGG